MKRLIFILIGLIVITGLVVLGVRTFTPRDKWVCENGQWVKQGDPNVSRPQEGCGDENNEDPAEKESPDFEENINISSPGSMQEVASPLIVQGEAKGSWFFEGSFPVRVLDANGENLGEGFVQSQGDWMTDDFVDFRGEVEFSTPTTDSGRVVLEKDNPSGLPQNSEQRVVVVKFSEADADSQ